VTCGSTCCEGTACCNSGTTCQTKHSNGLGQFFFDCAALGTYDLTQAMEACSVYPGVAFCEDTTCSSGPGEKLVCAVDNSNAPTACWQYAGTVTGHVAPMNGLCPTASDPVWD
jgi:hypothetical protein